MEMHDTLICSSCRLAKPTTDFWRNRNKKRGYAYECKSCANVKRRERRQAAKRTRSAKEEQAYRNRTNRSARRAYHRNPEVRRKAVQRWIDKHPLFRKVDALNRKAKQSGAKERISTAEIECLWEVQNQICPYTLLSLTYENATINHIVPLTQGGCNTLDNLVFVTKQVNYYKIGRSVDNFCKQAGLDCREVMERIDTIHHRLQDLLETDTG